MSSATSSSRPTLPVGTVPSEPISPADRGAAVEVLDVRTFAATVGLGSAVIAGGLAAVLVLLPAVARDGTRGVLAVGVGDHGARVAGAGQGVAEGTDLGVVELGLVGRDDGGQAQVHHISRRAVPGPPLEDLAGTVRTERHGDGECLTVHAVTRPDRSGPSAEGDVPVGERRRAAHGAGRQIADGRVVEQPPEVGNVVAVDVLPRQPGHGDHEHAPVALGGVAPAGADGRTTAAATAAERGTPPSHERAFFMGRSAAPSRSSEHGSAPLRPSRVAPLRQPDVARVRSSERAAQRPLRRTPPASRPVP